MKKFSYENKVKFNNKIFNIYLKGFLILLNTTKNFFDYKK
ncbi:hypothetical protein HMPREF1871_01227 [Gemelliphila asaccharolytica]|uniref:Uncharacterized protein n=1 Tax=Gemelliphila asaccharolytica TaxID=502393 RepID=A0ABR5TL89_9BACL|nr:hypothetical protein HMPREF1871_01227 [Gemella asaccharolytica]